MTRRTVLLLIGLFCCWNAEALAQSVDTSAADTLIEQTSSVTEAASQELEPVVNQVTPSGSAPSGTTDDSSGGTNTAQECETQPTKSGGSEEGGAVGGRASGGGPTSNGGTSASRAGPRDRVLAARRERARGQSVLGEVTEGGGGGGTPVPTPIPNPPSEFPFWGGLAVLLVLGLGFAGFVAALTNHLLRRTRSS